MASHDHAHSSSEVQNQRVFPSKEVRDMEKATMLLQSASVLVTAFMD